MANLLHISANKYPRLNNKDHFTKKIWLELAKGFDHYHILARSNDNKFYSDTEGNITLHLVPKLINKSAIFFFSSFYVFRIIKKLGITHLLAQSSIMGGFTLAIASKYYKIPLMTEIHGEEYFRFLNRGSLKSRALANIIDFTFQNSAVIRSLNNFMTSKLNKFGYNKNVILIPNRVDLSLFNKKKQSFEVEMPIKIVSVGRFVKEKNYLQLIQNLNAMNLDFELTLIGGGPLKASYLDYIELNEINYKVKLIDWIDQKDLVDLIVGSDIYVQYSISEGMPRAILEAMALRLPIITTNVGSISGVVEHEKNGLILNDFSAEVLYKSLLKMSNPEYARLLATTAFNDIREKYEWNKVFELYRSTLLNMNFS